MKTASRLIFSFLLCLALSLVGGCGKQDPFTYQDREYGFSFRYPEDWSINPGAASFGGHVIVAGQPDGGFAPNINIVVLPLNKDILKTTEEDVRKEYETVYRNLKIKNFTIQKLGGKESIFSHYQGTMDEELLVEQLQFAFLHKNKTFWVTISDSQANFEKNRNRFDSIIDSFRFD